MADRGDTHYFVPKLNNWFAFSSVFLMLSIIWMVIDARQRGANPWPFVVVTLFLGSFGPLLYLFAREWRNAHDLKAHFSAELGHGQG